MGRVSKRKVGSQRKRHPKYRSLEALSKEILADGRIDKDELRMIRSRVYADGIVDEEEADFLFKLNDATSDNDPGWQQLFVEAIAIYVLHDDVSPGAIDADEAKWLIERIQGDGKIDDNEAALLAYLKKHAFFIDPSLEEFNG